MSSFTTLLQSSTIICSKMYAGHSLGLSFSKCFQDLDASIAITHDSSWFLLLSEVNLFLPDHRHTLIALSHFREKKNFLKMQSSFDAFNSVKPRDTCSVWLQLQRAQ